MPRHSRTLSLALAAATLAACAGTPTESFLDAESQRDAAELERIADSLRTAGVDADVASAYRGVAGLARGGRTSPVVITVDGAATEFLATARELDVAPSSACSNPAAFCAAPPPLRSMIAWERANPRHVVQLTATPGAIAIGAVAAGAPPGAFINTATLTYLDGAGGVFVGTAGTQSIAATPSDTPCPGASLPTISPGGTCTLADFTVSFSGTTAPPPVPVWNSAAVGAHTLAMAPQTVAGSRIVLASVVCFACSGGPYPLGWLPPINLRGGALPARLTALVGASGVTFTFTVTNPQSVPVTLQFSSGQQYDFRVYTPDGVNVWTWSADRGFVTMLTSRTIAANGEVAYVEQWAPARAGSYIVTAALTSTSHHADAALSFTVP